VSTEEQILDERRGAEKTAEPVEFNVEAPPLIEIFAEMEALLRGLDEDHCRGAAQVVEDLESYFSYLLREQLLEQRHHIALRPGNDLDQTGKVLPTSDHDFPILPVHS
jgi:hypothetical protein